MRQLGIEPTDRVATIPRLTGRNHWWMDSKPTVAMSCKSPTKLFAEKPLLSTAMPSTVGTRRRFSERFADAHAASGRPEVRYLRVVIVTMYSRAGSWTLCCDRSAKGLSQTAFSKDVVRFVSWSIKKRWWESNPLKPGCSRPPSHLAPALR